jgi:broad specificity phosphatase PhoE
LTKTTIGFLRHGQTDWNVDFRLQGTADIPLNEVGKEQARRAASFIHREDWDALLSSPLSRAVDTAKIMAELVGFSDIEVEDLLLERAFGEAEGMLHEQWREKYGNHTPAPGSESLEDLATRGWLLLERLVLLHPGKRVLAVSHGAMIRKLLGLLSNGEIPPAGDRFGNLSLNIVSFDEKDWVVEHYDPKTLGA